MPGFPIAMASRKILVTGADGFIGSHLAEALARDGHDVRAFVFYNSFNSWGWLDHAEPQVRSALDVVAGDIRDPHGVRDAMRGCDMVLHLAALIAIPFSYASPSAYLETNAGGTLNLLQAARELGVSRFVHTSTSEVYGTAQRVPIDELHPLQAQSPYAATKIAADQLALSFHRSFDLPVTVLRPFNTFGPRQSARAVIPTIVAQMLNGRPVALGSTHPTRDFTFVSDTVEAFRAIMTADAAVGEVINAGSNFEISIGDVAQVVAEIVGRNAEVTFDEARQRPERSEVDRLWCDNGKAQRLMGWRPAYAGRDGFKRAIEATVAWFRDPVNLGRYKAERYNV